MATDRTRRGDSTVLRARKEIAKEYGLPVACIRLILPGVQKRAANGSKRIDQLRDDWRKSRVKA